MSDPLWVTAAPPVVADEAQRLGRDEVDERIAAVTQQLMLAGAGPGRTVTWSVANTVDAFVIAHAVWAAGAISNPVVNIYRVAELEFIVRQLRPVVVIGDTGHGRATVDTLELALEAAGVDAALLAVRAAPDGWEELWQTPTADPTTNDAEASPDATCLVLYTSGTTAEPKGVRHSRRTLSAEVESLVKAFDLSSADAIFMPTPIAHITGILLGVLLPSRLGSPLVIQDRWDAARAVDTIEREKSTFVVGAAVFLDGLVAEYERRGLPDSALRQFACGGAAVDPALIRAADRLGIVAYRVWGLTELPTVTLSGPADELERRATTDGRCHGGNAVRAVDASGRPLGVGIEGDLEAHGPERMLGYVDASLDETAFADDGWLRTGDVGVVDADGHVTITGRVKDIINRGGEKFSARGIELVLLGHPSVADAAVFGVADQHLGERVAAAVTLKEDATCTGEDLRAWALEQPIARQRVPAEIRVLTALPRTAAGKVQKFVLADSWHETPPNSWWT